MHNYPYPSRIHLLRQTLINLLNCSYVHVHKRKQEAPFTITLHIRRNKNTLSVIILQGELNLRVKKRRGAKQKAHETKKTRESRRGGTQANQTRDETRPDTRERQKRRDASLWRVMRGSGADTGPPRRGPHA